MLSNFKAGRNASAYSGAGTHNLWQDDALWPVAHFHIEQQARSPLSADVHGFIDNPSRHMRRLGLSHDS